MKVPVINGKDGKLTFIEVPPALDLPLSKLRELCASVTGSAGDAAQVGVYRDGVALAGEPSTPVCSLVSPADLESRSAEGYQFVVVPGAAAAPPPDKVLLAVQIVPSVHLLNHQRIQASATTTTGAATDAAPAAAPKGDFRSSPLPVVLITAEPTDTVAQLRKRIKAVTRIRRDAQRLFDRGQDLSAVREGGVAEVVATVASLGLSARVLLYCQQQAPPADGSTQAPESDDEQPGVPAAAAAVPEKKGAAAAGKAKK